jgi:hypothetical protein
VNPFLVALSENSHLQSLQLGCAFRYTAESLSRFRLHSNLQELEFKVSLDSELELELKPDIMHVFKQIIETCPQLQHVQLSGSHLTLETLGPICEALYKVQKHPVTLNLCWCTLDKAATDLLRSFLHDYPHPVNFWIRINLLHRNISHLIGPAVQKLILKSIMD